MKFRHCLAIAGLAFAGVAVGSGPAAAAPGCAVTYQASPWTESPGVGGFTANVTITNTGDPISGWTLRFTLPAGQSLTQGWSATWTGNGTAVSATNLDWNANLATGASTSIGFNGRWTGAYSSPTSFTLNNVACGGGGGGGGGNQAPTVSVTSPTTGQSFAAGAAVPLAANASDPDGTVNRVEFLVDGALVGTDTSAPYTASAPGLTAGSHTATARAFDNASPAASTTSAGVAFMVQGGGGGGNKVDNPFAGATGYVNPLWQTTVNQLADTTGGTLGAQMRVVGRSSTAVWMDRIAAIDPPNNAPGLVEHLDTALLQDNGNGAAPLAIQIVDLRPAQP